MPEFILPHGSAEDEQAFNELAPFVRGYIECMFFTDTNTGDDAEDGLEHASTGELAPESLAKIIAECEAWQAENASLLALAYQQDDYSEEQAGRDYWFTRNGHGCGFWDREQLTVIVSEGPTTTTKLGDVLSKAARYSSRSIYRGDDDAIHYTIG